MLSVVMLSDSNLNIIVLSLIKLRVISLSVNVPSVISECHYIALNSYW